MIEAAGILLLPDEAHALRHLSARRWLASGPRQFGTDRVLRMLARLGLASQCGRLFHATCATDRVAAALPADLPT